ncbi:Putative aquaporin NIP4-1 [Ancistrocladus abbreviatus]
MASNTDVIHEEEISRMEEGHYGSSTTNVESLCNLNTLCPSPSIVTLAQKLVAEVIGTYFVIFAGCGSVVVNKLYNETVTFPGICVTWGLIVMVMVYSVGHISGAHFNPAVTITFAIFKRFSFKEVSFNPAKFANLVMLVHSADTGSPLLMNIWNVRIMT